MGEGRHAVDDDEGVRRSNEELTTPGWAFRYSWYGIYLARKYRQATMLHLSRQRMSVPHKGVGKACGGLKKAMASHPLTTNEEQSTPKTASSPLDLPTTISRVCWVCVHFIRLGVNLGWRICRALTWSRWRRGTKPHVCGAHCRRKTARTVSASQKRRPFWNSLLNIDHHIQTLVTKRHLSAKCSIQN